MKKQIGLITFKDYTHKFGYIQGWENKYFFQFSNLPDIPNENVVMFTVGERASTSIHNKDKYEAFDISEVNTSEIKKSDKDYFLVAFSNYQDLEIYLKEPIYDYLIKLVNAKEYVANIEIEQYLKDYQIILRETDKIVIGENVHASVYFETKESYSQIKEDTYLFNLFYYKEIIWETSEFFSYPYSELLNKYKLDIINWKKLLERSELLTEEKKHQIRNNYNKEEHINFYITQVISSAMNDLTKKLRWDLKLLMARYSLTTYSDWRRK